MMAFALFFVLALAASASARPSNISHVPMEQADPNANIDLNSPLLLDDMLLVDGQLDETKTAGIPGEHLRWTGGRVPYVLDDSVSRYAGLIQQAIMDYHVKTCVRFVPRTFESNYIRILAGQGCYSNVGMIGGQQPVSLGQGCMFIGTIVHELGHAIGFFHEQTTSDRDDYVRINWENIQKDMESQFFLLKPEETILSDKYDLQSIMQYASTAFSKDGTSPTMEAINGEPLKGIREKSGLCPGDVAEIRKLYKC